VRIELFIGEGWSPFSYEEGEEVAWRLASPDELDVDATVRKLAEVFAARVRELYPDADVMISPQAASDGRLAAVDVSDSTAEAVDEALPLTEEELQGEGFDPGEMIAGEIYGQLDGIIHGRPNDYRVER
jgi:hypothetical protein